MKPKKIPERMCVGCREMKPKKELLRITRDKEGAVAFDPRGKMPGRGAYICPSKACLQRAKKARGLERALATQISDEVFSLLEGQIETLQPQEDDDE